MYSQNQNGAVNIAALARDPNALDRMPGMELTSEQKEISRKDREKLAQLLQYVMIAQLVGIIGNIAVGVAGIMFYDSSDGMPFPVGSFICGGVLLLSIFGAYNLRNSAMNFVPENKQTACCYLVLFEMPNLFILTGCMLVISFSVSSNTFADACGEASSSSSSRRSTYDCTSNPDADEYRAVAYVALVLVAYNIGLAIAAFAVMCTSPKAFATNQVAFNRPLVQSRHQQQQTLMIQQQLILQQQMAMQQQMQGQQIGTHPPPPSFGQSVYPPPAVY